MDPKKFVVCIVEIIDIGNDGVSLATAKQHPL
jgi:hypothetical protein